MIAPQDTPKGKGHTIKLVTHQMSTLTVMALMTLKSIELIVEALSYISSIDIKD